MATTQNMPHKLGGGEHEHRRPIYTGNRSGPAHRLRTEPYEYNSASNNVPPAGEFLRAPVCCSECEEFWKALILEVDEKHTSRVPAGKASLVMAKGASGSVLQIKSTKQHKERSRFFSGLGCKSTGNAFHTSCQPRVSSLRGHEYPQRKLNITTPMRSNHAYARQFEVQESLQRSTVGYNAQKHDVISIPRRQMYHTDRPRSAVYPQPPEDLTPTTHSQARAHAAPNLKPIRTHINRQEERFSHHQRIFTGSQSARCPSYTDASQLKPFLRPNLHDEKPTSRAPPREFLSHPSTPRMYTPMSQTPRTSENRVQEFLHRNFPSPTPSSRQRWDTQSYRDRRMGDSTPSPLPNPHDIATASPKHQVANPKPTPDSGHGRPLETKLSRTSTIESGYTSLSIPRSTCSASSSEEIDSPKFGRGRVFHTKTHRPQDLLRNNLSRTSTSASSLMEPIVLFTGHGCRSETDENSEDEEDVVVTNPSYFKHIIANPNYIKQVIKPPPPIPPTPQTVPKDHVKIAS